MKIYEITDNDELIQFFSDKRVPNLIDQLMGTQCTAHASFARMVGGDRVKIYQMPTDSNPNTIHEDDDSHDFAVLDGKYIVDTWMSMMDIGGKVIGKSIFPLSDSIPEHLYGDPSTWVRNEHLETRADKYKMPLPLEDILDMYSS